MQLNSIRGKTWAAPALTLTRPCSDAISRPGELCHEAAYQTAFVFELIRLRVSSRLGEEGQQLESTCICSSHCHRLVSRKSYRLMSDLLLVRNGENPFLQFVIRVTLIPVVILNRKDFHSFRLQDISCKIDPLFSLWGTNA